MKTKEEIYKEALFDITINFTPEHPVFKIGSKALDEVQVYNRRPMRATQAIPGDVVQITSSDWYIFTEDKIWREMTEEEQLEYSR